MTELPLPPDPTGEEVADTAAALAGVSQLADFLVGINLTPEQRRSYNAGMKALAGAQENLANVRRMQAERREDEVTEH